MYSSRKQHLYGSGDEGNSIWNTVTLLSFF